MSSLKTRFILIFSLFVFASCAVIALCSAFAITRTSSTLASRQGVPVVAKAADVIDGDEFEALAKNPSKDNPYYQKGCAALLEVKKTVGCRFLYTMVPTNGTKAMYILDGSCLPSDTENFSDLGTEEDIASYGKAPWLAVQSGGTISSGLEHQDEWGWIVSTYRAIKNSSGRVVGFIGCDIDMRDFVKTMQFHIMLIALIAFSFLCLGIAIVTLFTGSIFGKMKVISDAMQAISNGKADLTARIPEAGGSELTALAANCNKVIGSLNTLVKNLQGETGVLTETGDGLLTRMQSHIDEVNAAGKNIDGIVAQINRQKDSIDSITEEVNNVDTEIRSLDGRISEQSNAIQQSSSAVEEISSNIHSVHKNIETIIYEYETLVKDSADGLKIQDEVSMQINGIAQQSENLTEANEAIAAIAEQTNLLAMNAAIEAAHAGDLGKGFGVVADEIRSLAETSSAQSEAIKKLLEGISSAISGIVVSSQKSASSFDSMGNKISQLESLIKEVQNGMNEQDIGVHDILNTMKRLDETTAEITSSSAHIKDASKKLAVGAKDLRGMAAETEEKSGAVKMEMVAMKNAAKDAVSACDRNREAATKVSGMINGFKI